MKYQVYIIHRVDKSLNDVFIPQMKPFDTQLAAVDYVSTKKRHHPEQIFTIIKIY